MTTQPVSNGSTSPPAGIGYDTAYAPTSGENSYTPQRTVGLFNSGTTYTLYASALVPSEKWYEAGSRTFTTQTGRPTDFSWSYPKTSGVLFHLTALEWNQFTAKINSFRIYKNLSTISFTTAYTGNPFTAAMYMQARAAIAAMNPYAPPFRSSGDTVYASDLNGLRDALNNIN